MITGKTKGSILKSSPDKLFSDTLMFMIQMYFKKKNEFSFEMKCVVFTLNTNNPSTSVSCTVLKVFVGFFCSNKEFN